MPVFADLTEGNRNELKVAQNLQLPKGLIVTFDRRYIDYGLFQRWTDQGVYFVTRLKNKSLIEITKELPVSAGSNVLSDCLVRMTGYQIKKKCTTILRIVSVWDERNSKIVTFLTNNLKLAASTIAAIYRDRWEIELFFKVLKQHLKINKPVQTSLSRLSWTAMAHAREVWIYTPRWVPDHVRHDV